MHCDDRTHRLPLAAGVVLALATLAARAQDTSREPPASRPLLEQLTRETEALHREVQKGVLRVELPPPRWMGDGAGREGESPLTKYKDLDPKVREQLEHRARRAAAAAGEPVARGPAVPATTRAASDADVAVDANAAVIVVPPPPTQASTDTPAFEPNNVALVLDHAGHLLVPLYLEREAAEGRTIRVGDAGGNVAEARFVGSDRQTNLTVLKLVRPAGTPVRLGEADRPADGSLVFVVTPPEGSGRLAVWTGGARDYGLVFSVDGRCAGVARFGQFLGGRACRLIAEQIIRHGAVKRATLGVIVTQLPKDEAVRPGGGANASRGTMRVDQVMAGSPAEAAGIRAGDVLLTLAGETPTDIPNLAAMIAGRDGPTEIRVLRGEDEVTVTVDLRQK